jgi:hypothetical protein
MGWKRNKYDRRQKKQTPLIRELSERDGREFVCENYVFRPHFFYNYRSRVLGDPNKNIENEIIAKIAVHCFEESNIPERLKLGEVYHILVDFHIHQNSHITPLGIFDIPMKRDQLDLRSGRICPVTILDPEERYALLQEKRMI